MDELTSLLRANPQMVESITNSAYHMKDARGVPVGGDLFEWYATPLAPVLRQRGDLKDLVAVLRDAQAIAEARGTAIPEAVIDRFVAAKDHAAEQLVALVPSDAIRRRLQEQDSLAMRVLCLGDERLAAALPAHVGDLEPLLVGKGAVEALVDMLVALTGQDGAEPAHALPALAAFWRERPLPTGEEALDFVAACARQRCPVAVEAEWLDLLRASLPVAPDGIGNRRQWVKRLNEYPAYLRFVRPHTASEDDARLCYDALARLIGWRLKERAYGATLTAALPALFAATAPLVRSRADFVTLCEAMLPIVAVQPKRGGVVLTDRVQQQAAAAATLADFLACYPGAPEGPKTMEGPAALATASPEYQRFHESFFGDPYIAWHDGLDTQALLSLEGDERKRAEQVLLQALEDDGDSRVAVGVGVLGSVAAAGPLRRQLAAGGLGIVDVALALWRITREQAAAEALWDCLARGNGSTRMDAAIALREVPGEKTREALWRATLDDDSLVRNHAAESLLRLAGYQGTIDSPDHPAIRLMHDDVSDQLRAREQIGRLIGRDEPASASAAAPRTPAGVGPANHRPVPPGAGAQEPRPLVTLRLHLAEPTKIPYTYRNRWQDMIRVVKGDAPYLVFAGELVTLFSGGSKPRFWSDTYSDVGPCGERDRHWLLSSGGIRLERRVEQRVADGGQRVDVVEDWFHVTGLPGTACIDWDGNWSSGVAITIGNVPAGLGESALKTARDLFARVAVEQSRATGQP